MSRTELEDQQFYGLGIAPTLLERLEALGFKHPTPIQFKAIPVATGGDDVIGIAQTGTGKTLAFSIPMLQQMSARSKMGLVLLPTRELAVQVEETLCKLAGPLGLRTVVLIGGVSMGPQMKGLRAKPHVIVATPGRLIDHLEQKNVRLDRVGVLVLDEADRMLDMGFAPQLKKILAVVPSERQTMLFSATMPEEIAKIARTYMKSPLRVEVAPSGTAAEKVDQEVYIVPKAEKAQLLGRLLQEHKGTVLVFTRTKHGARKVARDVAHMRHTVAEIHSNRSQHQRQDALKGFSNGRYRVLVATDIAARGIDVKNIELVLNYDLPDHTEDYVHRIGRTGRAGLSGKAISLADPAQKGDIRQIERLIRKTLQVKTPSGELVDRSHDLSVPAGSSQQRRGPRPPFRGGNRSGRPGGRSGGYRGGPRRPR
ncbi:DEAD/DEAH box helicase [Candidatus Uhrbacteria bacterium]|nr:DEAD/DEAH box helicase [Candidatus Uhrbacteria bacterium]